jgi:8-oxo-dGTP diphosphatase
MSKTGVAAAVIVVQNGKILLLERKGSEGSGTWAIPGGKVDFMEDPADAASRELLEETALVSTHMEFIGYTNDIHAESDKHFVTLRFLCSEFTGTPTITEPDKCTAIDWFDIDDLPEPMFKPTHDLLKKTETTERIRRTKS